MKRWLVLTLALLLVSPQLVAKYKVKPLTKKAAQEYPDHQDFQKVVIAASPRVDLAGMMELFDAPKLFEHKIMPVLLVVENSNDFALRLREATIFFIDKSGVRIPPIPYEQVVLRISLKKPLTTYSTRPDILLRQVGNKDLVQDFEHKAFGEKLIAPHSSDQGVVFFPLPNNGDLSGTRLYLPEVYNLTAEEPLIFFEFDLGKSKP